MKKIITVLLTIIMVFAVAVCFGGCSIKYNAVLYDRAEEWITEDCAYKYATRYAKTPQGGSFDDSYPKEINLFVTSKEQLVEMFAGFPDEIDFEKQTVAVYFYTCNYMGRSAKLKSVKSDGYSLLVKVKLIKPNLFGKDASQPMQRCFVVVMDKITSDNVQFSVSDN